MAFSTGFCYVQYFYFPKKTNAKVGFFFYTIGNIVLTDMLYFVQLYCIKFYTVHLNIRFMVIGITINLPTLVTRYKAQTDAGRSKRPASAERKSGGGSWRMQKQATGEQRQCGSAEQELPMRSVWNLCELRDTAQPGKNRENTWLMEIMTKWKWAGVQATVAGMTIAQASFCAIWKIKEVRKGPVNVLRRT